MKRHSNKTFIDKAIKIHNDLYDYSQVEYKGQSCNVTIICKKHGPFSQKPKLHLRGNSCRSCADESRRGGKSRFIEKAENLHGLRYDYSEITLETGWKNSITIICPKHGPFMLKRAKTHVSTKKQGCPTCAYEILFGCKSNECLGTVLRKGFDSFLQKSKVVHNDF